MADDAHTRRGRMTCILQNTANFLEKGVKSRIWARFSRFEPRFCAKIPTRKAIYGR